MDAPEAIPQNTPMKALSLKEAAALLGVSYRTVYEHKREMGFFKVGAQWRVWPDSLKNLSYTSQRPAREEKTKAWPSSNAQTASNGGLISARQAAKELGNRLAQPTRSKPRNTTTR
ncbi:helix-turn-helix domain-containing protein [Paraburkholderia terrae]|uniref:helix-turn-helix domain-containing protein n=1 Tax=Paraburkholderia terrae TaxID=311230 RepID=UPI003A5C3414